MLDFQAIAAAALAQAEKLVPQWLPEGRVDGREYVARNPIRGDKNAGSFSVNLKTGVWKDFAAHDVAGKDLIALYAYLHTSDKQGEAARELGKMLGFVVDGTTGMPARPVIYAPAPAPEPVVMPILPPAGSPQPSFVHIRHGQPDMVWEYRDQDDKLMGFVARFNKDDGEKEVCPKFYFADGGWKWGGYKKPAPHPLYGLQRLKSKPGQNVLIVEGEKTAEAAQRLFPELVVLSWYGGTAKAEYVDMTPLAGRRVCFWPDFDAQEDKPTGLLLPTEKQPGMRAALALADRLSPHTNEPIFIVDYNPADFTESSGWDLADGEMEGWTTEAALEALKFSKKEIIPAKKSAVNPPVDQKPKQERALHVVPDPEPKNSAAPGHVMPEPNGIFKRFENNPHFRPVGYLKAENRTLFAIWNKRSRSVAMFKSSALTLDNLSEIAPTSFWELVFGPGLKPKELAQMVRESLVGACYAKPMYDPGLIRGRGAWVDKNRIVMHLGDHLLVDGEPAALDAIESRHLYEGGFNLPLSTRPATVEQGKAFVELCQMFTWDRPISAQYLAGWCFLAPICGALPWRPHIWLTGPAASGKSWINENVLQKMVGDYSLKVQSETTEAGIRQSLGSDALAIVFDEAEGETPKADSRIQNVLGLMRQSSSETGGAILKGSADGNAKAYRIRSMFAFSSITPGVYQHSDKTRVAICGLYTEPDQEKSIPHFASVKTKWKEVMSPDFIAGASRRAVDNIPLILEVFKLFSDQLTDFISSRRLADQYGMLLAGAWVLANDRLPTDQEIGDFLIANDWSEETQIMDDHDGMKCLRMILEKPLRVANAMGNSADSTIGELVTIVHNFKPSSQITLRDAEKYLSMYGIKVADDFIYISNSHSALASLLRDTPWPRNWNKILKHIPGSIVPINKKRFIDSAPIQRCVGVPMTAITAEE